LHLVGQLLTHIQGVYESLVETKPITGCHLIISFGSTKQYPDDGDGVIPYKCRELSHLGPLSPKEHFIQQIL